MRISLIFVISPLILSACSNPLQKSTVNVDRVKTDSEQKTVAINIDAPVNKVKMYRNTHSVEYLKQVFVTDGKVSAQQIKQITYGTTVKGLISKHEGNTWIASLEIDHSCRPNVKRSHFNDAIWVDLPSQKAFSTRQTVLMKHGEALRISGKGFNTSCAFPTIILHPIE